jgi:hypothetical protein
MKPKPERQQKLNGPGVRGDVWLHIDRIDNANGNVWAVQWCRPDTGKLEYHVAKRVTLEVDYVSTIFTGAKGRQPRAYLFIQQATVEVYEGVVRVRAAGKP